jgi:hypothetical protein
MEAGKSKINGPASGKGVLVASSYGGRQKGKRAYEGERDGTQCLKPLYNRY